MKLQLSLEFMLIFSFVLIVFIFTFALIANQRAIVETGETLDQLQATAQQIALQLSTAQQSGNGYQSRFFIPSSIGALKYNISITKGGIVVIQAVTGKQIVQAIAYSSVAEVASDPAYFTLGAYSIPIANGSITVQNSFGTICVDLSCRFGSDVPASVSLSAQSVSNSGLNNTMAISAKVTNAAGEPISGALVGFATTLGSFGTNGISTASFTDSNGVAAAYLQSQGNGGYAVVKATAYNGNASAQSSLVGWWPLNIGQGNAAPDLSGNGNDGQFNGLVSWSQPDYAMSFDGQSGYVSIPNSAALNSGTVTVNLWFNPALYGNGRDGASVPNPASGATSVIVGHGYPGMWWFEYGDNGYLYWSVDANTIPTALATNATPQLNRWYMLTGIFNASSGELDLYVDGVLVGTGNTDGASVIPDMNNLLFSGINNASLTGGHFDGKLANVQVYDSVLSPGDVQLLYQQGIASSPIGSSSIAGWWPLDGNANDYSINGDNGTIYGGVAPSQLLQNGTVNQASILTAGFNGTSSSVSSRLRVQTDALTLTMWVNASSLSQMTSSSGYTVANASGTNPFELFLTNGNGLGAAPGTGDEQIGVGPNIYPGYGVGTGWTFLAVSLDSGTASFYVDGSPAYTISPVAAPPYSLTGFSLAKSLFGIGAFNGSMANVQLYNASLTPSQIYGIYRSGTTGTPVPNSQLLLWYPLEGNTQDFSGNGNNGTASAVAYSQQEPVTPSLLNSNGQYGASFSDYAANNGNITVDSSGPLDLGSSFTISFWVYKDAQMASCDVILAKSSCTSAMCIYSQTKGGACSAGSAQGTPLTFEYVDSSSAVHNDINSSAIPAQTWAFATLVFNSGTATWYVNGQQTGNYTGLPNPATNSDQLVLGGTPSFNGTIADVRVYDAALSQVQVEQAYQAGTPPVASKPVALGVSP